MARAIFSVHCILHLVCLVLTLYSKEGVKAHGVFLLFDPVLPFVYYNLREILIFN